MIDYDAMRPRWDEKAREHILVPCWKFRPSQKIWWWEHVHQELHQGVITQALWESGWDTKWLVNWDDLQIKVNGSDIYATKEEAVAHRLKVVSEQLNTLKYSTAKCKDAEATLLRLLEANDG